MEEIAIGENSRFSGMTLLEANLPEQTGLIILALKKYGDTNFRLNPRSHETMDTGDTMIVLGTSDQVDRLQMLVNG